MRFDVAGLTEDDVRAMNETAVLDLDMDGLHCDLPERLNALPPEQFVAVYVSCLADLRDHHGDQAGDMDLINRTITLASGEDAEALLASWHRHIGFDEDGDDLDIVGDETAGIELACVELAYQVARDPALPTAAGTLADAAFQAYDDFEAGVNIRWLLRFNIRAELARPQHSAQQDGRRTG